MEIQPEIIHIQTYDVFTPSGERDWFDQCTVCDTRFKNDSPQYVIEKEFQRSLPSDEPELIYELALCQRCLSEQDSSYSNESREHIARFYSEVVDLDRRASELLQEMREEKRLDIRRWIGQCAVTNQPIEKALRYRLMAHGLGQWLAMAAAPLVLSGSALEQFQSGLSDQTNEVGCVQ